MEKEELLHGKTKMRGLHEEDSESEEIEIFNRRRPGNQGRSCEVCGVLLVLLCLIFFAATIIFGARYMSALRQIDLLEEENERLKVVLSDPELPNDIEKANKIVELQNKVTQLEEEIQNCRSDLQNKPPEIKTEDSDKTNNQPIESPEENEPSESETPATLLETPKNWGSKRSLRRFETILMSLVIVGIQKLLVG